MSSIKVKLLFLLFSKPNIPHHSAYRAPGFLFSGFFRQTIQKEERLDLSNGTILRPIQSGRTVPLRTFMLCDVIF